MSILHNTTTFSTMKKDIKHIFHANHSAWSKKRALLVNLVNETSFLRVYSTKLVVWETRKVLNSSKKLVCLCLKSEEISCPSKFPLATSLFLNQTICIKNIKNAFTTKTRWKFWLIFFCHQRDMSLDEYTHASRNSIFEDLFLCTGKGFLFQSLINDVMKTVF